MGYLERILLSCMGIRWKLRWQDIINVDPNLLDQMDYCSFADVKYECADYFLDDKEWNILEKIRLTPRQLQCMWLYYWKNMTQNEIGEVLGITQPVVSIYLRRAKGRIARHYNMSTDWNLNAI